MINPSSYEKCIIMLLELSLEFFKCVARIDFCLCLCYMQHQRVELYRTLNSINWYQAVYLWWISHSKDVIDINVFTFYLFCLIYTNKTKKNIYTNFHNINKFVCFVFCFTSQSNIFFIVFIITFFDSKQIYVKQINFLPWNIADGKHSFFFTFCWYVCYV